MTATVESVHDRWMRIALEMADLAAEQGEVPVGAVLVGESGEISRGYNRPISTSDPTAHAEVVALRLAGERVSNYRLAGTTLYVTVEPCTMCAGAMVHARVGTLVFGALEPKGGAIVSRSSVLEGLNHEIEVVPGVLEKECGERLTRFFADKRGIGSTSE
jgi:tRNA(adenine34) deaminase